MNQKTKKISKNFIDKAVEFVSPITGARRRHARIALAMADTYYPGASKTRRSLFTLNGVGMPEDADSLLQYERQTLVDRSRELVATDPIVSGLIGANCTSIVGAGLKFQSRLDAAYLGLTDDQQEEKENLIEREFGLFSDSVECDYSRQLNFDGIQDLSLRQFYSSGESIALVPFLERAGSPYGLKVQLLESERLCNKDKGLNRKLDNGNYIYDGIEKDKNTGAPVKYYICSDFPTNYSKGNSLTWAEINAFSEKTSLPNVLHIYKILRPGQTRGVPPLAPIIDLVHNLTKYDKAVLDGAIVQTLFTVFLKTERGDADISNVNTSSETGSKKDDDDLKLAPGGIFGLKPNEDIVTASPGMPQSNFDPFTLSMFRRIGIAFEIPYEVLIKHFSSSYSASRAALLEAWRFFKTRRLWFARLFCQPIFESFMYEAVARGRIDAPGFFDDPMIRRAYCSSIWVGPSPGHINPVDEANAIGIRTAMRLTTMTDEAVEYNGGNFERNVKQSAKEQRMIQAAGISIPGSSEQTATGNKIDQTMGN